MTQALEIRQSIKGPIVVLDAEVVERAAALLARDKELPPATSPDDLAAVDALAKEAYKLAKEVERQRKLVGGPIREIGKAINEAAAGVRDPLEGMRKRRDAEIARVQREQERKRLEAEAERRRIEEEAERKRRAAEEERERLAKLAAQAETPEDREAVAELQAEQEQREHEVRSASAAAWVTALDSAPPPTPKTGVHTRKRKEVEIVDLAGMPAVYNGVQVLQPDKAVIKKILEAGLPFPWARLVEVEGTARR